MKNKIPLILIILTSLYSCNEFKTNQQADDSILIKKQDKNVIENDYCNYSVENIGKNSKTNSQITAIGIYENLENNGESSYGYSLMIWELNSELIGFLSFYEGGPEPIRDGSIIHGNIDNNNLNIQIWTKQNKSFKNWEKSDAIIYNFKLEKVENKLTGSISAFNCTSNENIILSDDKIELVYSDMWELKKFNNIEEWKEEFSLKLNY